MLHPRHRLFLLLALSFASPLVATPSQHRLTNLSSRASTGSGDDTTIAGFVVEAGAPKSILIRAAGPALVPHGVANPLADPLLTLFNSAGQPIASNDNWSVGDTSTFSSVGAFAFAAGSRDAALVLDLAPGSYTAHVTGGTGVCLIEVYDVSGSARLKNISTRARVLTDDGILIAGLVVSPVTPQRRVLLRAAGPSLATFGVGDPLADPVLRVIRASDNETIAMNDDWESAGASAISAATAESGAFAFAPGSRDAALVLDLAPGNYTIHVSGAGNTTGIALVEAYDLTPAAPTVSLGAATNTLTFTRTGSTAASLAVTYTLGGSAAPGSDFTGLTPSGSLTFAAGSATATATITPAGSLASEKSLTVSIAATTAFDVDRGSVAFRLRPGGATPEGSGLAQTLTVTSNTSGDMPLVCATVLPKGQFAAGTSLTTTEPGIAVIVKRRWNDGSPKHVILAGRAAVTANTPKPITLSAGSASNDAALTVDHIRAAAPHATVTLSAVTLTTGTNAPLAEADISASLASVIAQAPQRIWLATPEMVECHWLAKPRADVTVWFHVRHFAGGHTWVRTLVEYSRLPYTSNTYLTYTPTATIGGSVLWNNGSAPYNHGVATRWSVEGWHTGGADVTVRHDTEALRATQLVPSFLARHPTEGELTSLGTTYTPGALVNLRGDYTGTGYSPQIGLIPLWDQRYVTSGDVRAWRSVQANSLASGTQPTIWRDPNTNEPARLATYPNWSYAGANQGGYTALSARNQIATTGYSAYHQWDTAHNASSGYTAYLITGDYVHLEIMQMQCSSIFLSLSTSNGAGSNRRALMQTRGIGWFFRTIGQYLGLAPDTGVSAEVLGYTADIQAWLEFNVAYHTANGPGGPNAESIGYPLTVGTYDSTKPLSTAPWMHEFWIMSMGHASDLEPLDDAAMPAFTTLRDWMYRGIVGYLGDGSPGTFDYRYAGGYTLTVSSVVRPNYAITFPDQLFQNWGQVWAANLDAINATADSNGHPRPAVATSPTLYSGHFGYYNNLLPAIAYAAAHRAPGAAGAWHRLTGATNWGALNHSVASQPMWSVCPPELPSVLEIAAAMSPGSWHDVPGTNINEMETTGPGAVACGMLESAPNSIATNWGGKIAWDAQRRRILGVGTSQGYSSESPAGAHSKQISFDVDRHTFAVKWNPTSRSEAHFYDQNCSLVHHGKSFRRSFTSPIIQHYDADTDTWSDSAYTLAGLTGGSGGVSSIEIHPTLGADGSLLAIVGTQLVRWDLATGMRSVVGTYAGMTGYYGLMHYVPGWNRVVFGGGTAAGDTWYSIDSSGVVTDTGWTSPLKISCGGDIGVFLPDPAGRAKSWWLDHATRKMYSIDWSTNTWTDHGGFARTSSSFVGTALTGHGVLAYFEGVGREGGRTRSRLVLYRTP